MAFESISASCRPCTEHVQDGRPTPTRVCCQRTITQPHRRYPDTCQDRVAANVRLSLVCRSVDFGSVELDGGEGRVIKHVQPKSTTLHSEAVLTYEPHKVASVEHIAERETLQMAFRASRCACENALKSSPPSHAGHECEHPRDVPDRSDPVPNRPIHKFVPPWRGSLGVRRHYRPCGQRNGALEPERRGGAHRSAGGLKPVRAVAFAPWRGADSHPDRLHIHQPPGVGSGRACKHSSRSEPSRRRMRPGGERLGMLRRSKERTSYRDDATASHSRTEGCIRPASTKFAPREHRRRAAQSVNEARGISVDHARSIAGRSRAPSHGRSICG
jgi:hypothetical protein